MVEFVPRKEQPDVENLWSDFSNFELGTSQARMFVLLLFLNHIYMI
jgi:hypothetical protein